MECYLILDVLSFQCACAVKCDRSMFLNPVINCEEVMLVWISGGPRDFNNVKDVSQMV